MSNRPQNMPRQTLPRRQRQSTSAVTVIFAFVLVICLSVTMGYLVTKQIIYPYILKQNLSDHGDTTSSGGIVVDENEIPPAKPPANDPVVSEGDTSGESTQTGSDRPAQEQTGANDTASANQTASPTTNPTTSDSKSPAPVASPAPTDSGSASGYCLQYANVATKDAADQFVSELKAKGISGNVKESGGRYKVVSGAYATKDEARAHLPAVSTVVPDAFVTTAL